MAVSDKRAQVLKSAYEVFLRYGFSRTTMDDIAKDAGMSRPALYLLFKNKEEIFRGLAQNLCDQCIVNAETALKAKLKKPEKLLAILNLAILDVLAELSRFPHGEELMGLKYEIAADIDAYWQKNTSRVLAEAIGGEEAAVRASLILDAVKGMSSRGLKVAEVRKKITSLLKLV